MKIYIVRHKVKSYSDRKSRGEGKVSSFIDVSKERALLNIRMSKRFLRPRRFAEKATDEKLHSESAEIEDNNKH